MPSLTSYSTWINLIAFSAIVFEVAATAATSSRIQLTSSPFKTGWSVR